MIINEENKENCSAEKEIDIYEFIINKPSE